MAIPGQEGTQTPPLRSEHAAFAGGSEERLFNFIRRKEIQMTQAEEDALYERLLEYEKTANSLLWRSIKDAFVEIWRIITGRSTERW